MVSIGNITRALGAGAVGGVVNVIILVIIWKVTGAPRGYSPDLFAHQMAWGAIWGLVFLIPFLKDNWWQRGLFWGLIATIVFIAWKGGMDFANVKFWIAGVLANMVGWGLSTSWLYSKS